MNKPVLFRVTNNLNLGGVQRRLASALPRLTDEYEVHVITYRDQGTGALRPQLEAAGAHCHYVPVQGKWSPVGIRAMADLMKEHHADIVHTHSLGGNITGILAASLAGVDVRIAQVHLSELHWYADGWKRRKQILQETMVHRLFTDRICFVSKESMDYFLEQTGLDESIAVMLRNGVDFSMVGAAVEREAARVELGLLPEHTAVGFVGRLDRGKGYPLLLSIAEQTARTFPQLRFIAVGRAPDMQALQLELDERGLTDRVTLTGPRMDIGRMYAAFDAFAFLSEEGVEGMPGTALEAAGFGLPIVSTPIKPMQEIAEVYTRIAFSPSAAMEDAAVFGDVLEAAFRLPADDGTALRAEFSIEAMVERTKRLYAELMEIKSHTPPTVAEPCTS